MLAIAGGKGGAGKTTLAAGLALALARSGRDPVVVDADVDMPDLHLLAEVPGEPTADAIAAGRPPGEVIHRSPELAGAGVVTAGRPPSVPAALDRLSRWHGPVLIDCPAGAGGDAARPLRACERSVLVTTDTPAAREDTHKTAAVARRLDATPHAVLVRGGPDRGGFDCPVERLPAVGSGPVYTHPRCQGRCETVVGAVVESRRRRAGHNR
jgi:septum site-determining protein MinD